MQLLTSFGPFLAGCAAMYLVYPLSPWLTLALAVPTGALLVRVFIVQHDCGHGSFFASRRANALVGRLCSLITLTPFANWGRQHGLHHADWNNLDRTGGGADIYSSCLTVRSISRCRRGSACSIACRAIRWSPTCCCRRWSSCCSIACRSTRRATGRRERCSVYLTNPALIALFGTLVASCSAGRRSCWSMCR